MKESSQVVQPSNRHKLELLIEEIEQVIRYVDSAVEKHEKALSKVHPKYRESAENLLHYTAMRSKDLSRVQKRLKDLGLSRLAKAESHVMPSLIATRSILCSLADHDPDEFDPPGLSIKQSKRRHKKNVNTILGLRPKGRNSRIMVTMPTEASENLELVSSMISAGMNIARVNCAHDDEAVWLKIIENIRSEAKAQGTTCLIAMDLAGPKIRTGQLEEGPQIMKVRVQKNLRGRVVESARVWVGNNPGQADYDYHLMADIVARVRVGSVLHFRDTRSKKRKLRVIEASKTGFLALLDKVAYFERKMPLYHEKELIHPVAYLGELPPAEGSIYLRPGDNLILTEEPIIARHKPMGVDTAQTPRLHCTNTKVLRQIKKGEPVLFDDGKFSGTISSVENGEVTIKIRKVRGGGARLKADKGINFPKSKLTVSGLTVKDKTDLKFVVKHADMVNMSFVNSSKDVRDLMRALRKEGASAELGVVLKIETHRAFRNLVKILLEGMQMHPIGVMIARGDLAIEVGWERIAIIQREIMKMCHAAHVPDIWATQVFENLAKSGVPSRAEMTDVWVAQRSECVMLNKGPYIVEAIELLDTILSKMQVYHDKDSAMLPSLKKAIN